MEDLYGLVRLLATLPDYRTDSEPAFYMSSYWLLRCLKRHAACHDIRLGHRPLPTRVIDVGPVDEEHEPVLYETYPGESGYYCTLTYRWPMDPLRTTTENLFTLKQAIPRRFLPPVIRDAIATAKKLGFRYLWVDALCIVQDSPTKPAEISKMDEIYRNSTLTIAASNAIAGATSCLFQARQRDFHNDHRPSGVIDTRGWILQEQLLSPRVLTYSEGQLFWTCASVNASETLPGGKWRSLDRGQRDSDIRGFKENLAGVFSFEHQYLSGST